MRSITNVLAQCRFHRISKMTSSNPHPTSPPPLGLAPSPHGLAHLSHLHLAFPPTCNSNPSHSRYFALLSSSTRVEFGPYPVPTHPILPYPPDSARVILHYSLHPDPSSPISLFSLSPSSCFLLPVPAFRLVRIIDGRNSDG